MYIDKPSCNLYVKDTQQNATKCDKDRDCNKCVFSKSTDIKIWGKLLKVKPDEINSL